MHVRYLSSFAVATALILPACSRQPDDATIARELVGTWSFNPRKQFPKEKIEDDVGAYTTPDETIVQFGPAVATDSGRGAYVEYAHIPEHTLSTTQKAVPARWAVKHRCKWYVVGGKVSVQGDHLGDDTDFTVVRASTGVFRLSGVWFPCKDGCALDRLKALPDVARAALPW